MMKKFLVILLALALVFAFAACTKDQPAEGTPAEEPTEDVTAKQPVALEDLKVGFIHINDEADQGYSYAHIMGRQGMVANLGLSDDQVISKFNVSEDSVCADAILELVEAGCQIIFADSFGYGDYMLEAAKEYPNVEFYHATGNLALTSGLPNFHNYFGNIYEARYLCGMVAGLMTETNKLGYVTAMEYAECVSGFTGFFLGARSVNPDVTMDVIYTNSWYDVTLETQAAQALIDGGADVLCQHADSTATQTTCEQNGVFGIGYNSDMSAAAPAANLCSAVWDWSAVYTQAVQAVIDGTEVAADLSGDLANGMVDIVFNDALVPQDIQDQVMAVRDQIISGEIYVFSGPINDADGNVLVAEGEQFIEPQSAPSWTNIVEGITVVR